MLTVHRRKGRGRGGFARSGKKERCSAQIHIIGEKKRSDCACRSCKRRGVLQQLGREPIRGRQGEGKEKRGPCLRGKEIEGEMICRMASVSWRRKLRRSEAEWKDFAFLWKRLSPIIKD